MTNSPLPFGPTRTPTDSTQFGARMFRRIWNGRNALRVSPEPETTLEWRRHIPIRPF